MKTTQLLIEHLISGVQGLVWLVLLVMIFVGTDILVYVALKDYEAIVLTLLVSIVYPWGIIIDNVADHLLKARAKAIRASIPGGSQSTRYLLTQLKDESMNEYVNYLRTRIRVSRSSAFNFGMITLFAILLTIVQAERVNNALFGWIALEFLVGGLMTFLAFLSWKWLMRTFGNFVAARYKELE